MKVSIIYGNPKKDGFVHGCLDWIGGYLERNGVEVEKIRLVDKHIEECTGCFTCLRRGECPLNDDLPTLMVSLKSADGLVAGASVRNRYFPALLKRFYERITYRLGFTRDLKDKLVLAVGAVGMAGGKKNLGELLKFKGFMTLPSDYLFFRTGIPGKLEVRDVDGKLRRAADRFLRKLQHRPHPSLLERGKRIVDDTVVRNLMLKRNPDGVYDYIIQVWRKKGLMK